MLAYNLPGIENLKLTREAYAGIFLGKIKKWNDKAIADVNPDVKLPDKRSIVVRVPAEAVQPTFSPSTSARSAKNLKSINVSAEPEMAGGNQGQGQRRRR